MAETHQARQGQLDPWPTPVVAKVMSPLNQSKRNDRCSVGACLLVCDKDLEGGDEVCHWDGLVTLPLLEGLDIVQKDNEVVLVALEVDLDLRSFALDHFGGCSELSSWMKTEV
jgi:hypothetical protein